MKQLLIVFTILLVASVSAQPGCVSGNTGQITLLASDPIAFYPLNELEQASMYCYNTRGGCPTGTYINNPLLGRSGVHPPPNAQDASVYFNPSLLGLFNVGQYAIIPADPIFNTPSFTVEIWNKPEVEQLLTAAPLVGSLASPATGGMQIVLTTQLFYRCDIALVNGNIFSISSPISLHLSILKMWSHVACTYDAATFELTLIVDGENLASATAPAAFLPTDGPFLIARLPDLSSIEYPGNLDELAFYDRAVPDRELKEHWSDVFVYKFIVDGFDPVGFYRFETLDPLNPILFNWGTGGSALDMATIVNLGGVPLITGALPGIDFFYTNNGLTSALLAPVSQFFTGGFRSGLNTRDFTIIVYADPIISNLITGAVILDSSDTVGILGTRVRGYRFEYNNANEYVASIVTSNGIRTVRHAPGLQQTHIAVTYNDTTGYFAMYSDGIEVDRVNVDPGTYMPATGSRTTLAGSDSGLISSFTGFLDEIQYYDVSLTPQNIQDIYNAGVEQCTAPGTCPASTICVPYGAACFDCITVTSQIINGVDITANGQADREQTDATWDLVHTGITTNDYIAYMEPGDDPNDPSDPATLYGVQQYNPGNNNIVDFTQVDPTVDMLQVVTRLASAPELGWIPWDVFVTLIIDTDKDGIPNDTDLDIDNDGIPNTQEGAGDTDGDGIPDVEDLDSDNDGIPDIIEAGGQDTDGNGRVDSFVDVNGDGYDDILAMNPLTIPNSDSDAYSNVVDRDSDNDGIPDLVEMGYPDVDNNGAVDNMVDANNNGWDDAHEGIRTMPDVDGDGFSNYIDRDSDGDGIFDITEAGPPFATNDNNNDGIVDGFTANGFGMHIGFQVTPLPIPDSDGDGVKDFVDLDSDNDLINDAIESGGVDLNGDGIHDAIMGDTNNDGIDDGLVGTLRDRDTDSDGIPDRIDIDSENDGVSDLMEQTGSDPNGNGRVSSFVDSNGDGLHDGAFGTVAADQDGDGVPNYRDLDSDNDGVTDIREANSGVDADGNGILDIVVDANNDGLHDPIDTSLAPDTDGDGLRDFLDADSDNDTIPDTIESGIADTNFDGRMDVLTGDLNNNGLDDALEGVSLAPVDSDNDLIPDRIDVDSDNDGITDLREQLYDDVAGNGMLTITDLNNDGLHDPASGMGPIDTDNDMVRNNLDLDSDNDGLPDLLEGQISAPSANGAVISPLTDVNGDGLHDSVLGSTLPDTDGDSIPDFVDADSDGDGTPDVVEAGGFDSDLNAVIDGFIDVNGDGLNDDILTTPLSNGDNDNDGVPDVLDIDSDNDGIPDSVEVFGISADLDKDGQIDDTTDVNGNGLSDAVESLDRSRDTDGDLIQDKFDLDSDNDGIPDVLEAGGQDANGDGRVDSILPDANGNGMADALETTPLPILDRDADGASDFIDLDTDGDGIPDVIEGGSPDVDNNGMIDPTADLNNNGLDDSREISPLVLPNSDNDATPDFADLDSDNDSYSDLAEAGFYTVTVVDSSDDGIIDGSVDADNDGILDSVDSDPNNFGSATPTQLANIDGDSLPDYIDPRNNLTGQLDIDLANNGVDSPLDADNDGMIDSPVDADSDGIADNIDILLGTFGGIPFPRDTDGDTITDIFDGDSDNDGILDVVEGNNDTDGDGIPDFLDLDSDGDGIPDIVEAGLPDVDGDGKVDMFEDVNGDGVDDNVALSPVTPPDTDNDGIPDYQDLDSDNDGAYDVAESQIPDLDNDGKADGVDSNHDGLVDVLPNHTVDTDNDGVIDRLDHDSDNDGIPDVIENGYTDTDNDNQIDNFTDANNDGYDDNLVPGAPLDSDNDGVSDYIDLDSDNDGLFDIAEAGGVDTNNDGIVDNFTDGNGDGLTDDLFGNPLPIRDSDGDGFLDTQDLDADNDGISDNIENGLFTDTDGNGIANGGIDANGVPVGATSVLADTDNDGVANFQDLDTDNDGIFDIIENGGVDVNMDGMVDSFMDNNSNGFHDPIEGTLVVLADSDSDGVPNLQDLDGDNDGIYDVVESGLTDTDSDGMVDAFVDTNLDGVHDDLNASPRPVIDTDNDGVYDALDLDSDNDGISDHLENGLNADTDGDGRVDEPVGPNGAAPSVVSNVFDSDNDGVRDMLDLDSDNDGIPDVVEAGIIDSNGDGEVDNFTDLNGNGFHDGAEGQLLVNPDLDGDGVANTRDLDSDNDAITDVVEAGGQDTNGDGMVDNYSDSVFPNGWNDRTELTPLPFPDTDGDGAYDLYDLDTDNDGIPDVVEVGFQHPGNWMYPIGVDTNQNGRADDLELIGFINLDTDNDGVGNDKDLDSDNDAVSDLRENGDNIDADTLDADNNGVLDGIDSDGDGIVDSVDNFVGFGNNAPTNAGTGFISVDSDGDGIFDIDVYRPDLADSRVDLNNDGIIDGNFDSDGDGIIDLVDEAIGFFGGLSFPSPSVPSPPASPSVAPASPSTAPSAPSASAAVPSSSPLPVASASSAPGSPSRTPDAQPSSSSAPSASSNPLSPHSSTPLPIPTMVNDQTSNSAEIEVSLPCKGSICTEEEIEIFIQQTITFLNIEEDSLAIVSLQGNVLTFIVCDSLNIPSYVNSINDQQFSNNFTSFSRARVLSVVYDVPCEDYLFDDNYLETKSSAPIVAMSILVNALLAILIL